MRLKPQHILAGAIPVVVLAYFIVRGIVGGAEREAQAAPKAEAPTVQAALIEPTVRPYTVVMRGRTMAARIVSVRSETSGVVAATPVREGAFVRQGEVLCRLAVDARQASLDQARAQLRSRQLQQKASADLQARGFRSETQTLVDQANLDQAAAAVRQAEVAMNQTLIRAPFGGVLNKRVTEVGAYLAPGGECGVVLELDPLKIDGVVPETEVARLRVGSPATAVLTSGQRLTGVVYYVAKDADPQTRTYPVLIMARNPGSTVAAGMSAQISVQAGQGPAHLVPSSALVLDAAGRQGLRYVHGANRVAFAPVTVIDETPQGVWVTGLTGPVRVITVGQSYVSEGQAVRVAAR